MVPHFYHLGNVGVEKWFDLMLCFAEKKRYSKIYELLEYLMAKKILNNQILEKFAQSTNQMKLNENDPKTIMSNIISSFLNLHSEHEGGREQEKLMPLYLDLFQQEQQNSNEGETMISLLNKLYNLSGTKFPQLKC